MIINIVMDISNTNLENTIKFLLQRNLNFSIKNKIVKRGKLILFKQNNFGLDLHIIQHNKDKHSIYTIPIPFNTITNEHSVVFDYTLKALSKSNTKLLNELKKINPARKTKFYDTQLIMEFQ